MPCFVRRGIPENLLCIIGKTRQTGHVQSSIVKSELNRSVKEPALNTKAEYFPIKWYENIDSGYSYVTSSNTYPELLTTCDVFLQMPIVGLSQTLSSNTARFANLSAILVGFKFMCPFTQMKLKSIPIVNNTATCFLILSIAVLTFQYFAITSNGHKDTHRVHHQLQSRNFDNAHIFLCFQHCHGLDSKYIYSIWEFYHLVALVEGLK